MLELSVLALAYLKGFVGSSLLYCFYIENSPSIGHIFFRPDSEGNIKFRVQGISALLKEPLKNWAFWSPSNWDINWITFTQISTGVYMLLSLV